MQLYILFIKKMSGRTFRPTTVFASQTIYGFYLLRLKPWIFKFIKKI